MILSSDSKILIILAHPDDEVLGAGGFILKAKASGASVKVVWLGEGISARFNEADFNNKEYNEATAIRQLGAKEAMLVLGVDDYSFGNWHCLRFDQIPILDITKKIELEIKAFDPDLLITHNPSEVNIDHVLTFKAVEAATRPNFLSKKLVVWGCEIACSGRWVFEKKFNPNIYVDINNYFEKKLLAWSKYKGEARDFPFPRSNEGLKTLAKYRGMESGLQLAEAFKLWRQVI